MTSGGRGGGGGAGSLTLMRRLGCEGPGVSAVVGWGGRAGGLTLFGEVGWAEGVVEVAGTHAGGSDARVEDATEGVSARKSDSVTGFVRDIALSTV